MMPSPLISVQLTSDLEHPIVDNWDRFVEQHPHPHPQQTSSWARVQLTRGWSSFRLLLTTPDHTLPVGGVQVLVKPFKKIGTLAYVQRGPLLSPEHPELGARLLPQLALACRQYRVRYLSMIRPYDHGPGENQLRSAGYFPQPDFLPPQTSEKATLIIDLRPPLDEILSRMRTTTRRYIRQSLRSKLSVRMGTRADLPTFGRLIEILCHRRGVRSNVPTKGEYLFQVWDAFQPRNQLALFMTEWKDQPIGALMVLLQGQWARAWRIGWSGEGEELRPNERIYWEAIQWAKANGAHYFDLMGFNTRIAHALNAGQKWPDVPEAGMAYFKLSLGGNPMVLPPYECRFFPTFLQHFMRHLGLRLLAQKWASSLMRQHE